LGLREANDVSDLLTRIQPYINYEEKRLVEEALKNKQSGKGNDEKWRRDGEKVKSRRARFAVYTPLNLSQEAILHECLNTEFKEAGIKPLQPLISPQVMVRTPMTIINCAIRLKS